MKSQLLFISLLCSVVRMVSFQHSGFYLFENVSLKCSSEKVSSPRPGKAGSACGSSWSLWPCGWGWLAAFASSAASATLAFVSSGMVGVRTRPLPERLLPLSSAGTCSSRARLATSSGQAWRPPPFFHRPRLRLLKHPTRALLRRVLQSQLAETVLKAGRHLQEPPLPCPSEIGTLRERTSPGVQCVPSAGAGRGFESWLGNKDSAGREAKKRKKPEGWALDPLSAGLSPPTPPLASVSRRLLRHGERGAVLSSAGRAHVQVGNRLPVSAPCRRPHLSKQPLQPPQRRPCLRWEEAQPSVPPAWGGGSALSSGGLAV